MRGAAACLVLAIAAAPAFAGNVAYVDYAHVAQAAPQTAASRRLLQKDFAGQRKAILKEQAKVKELHRQLRALGPETNALERAAAVENLREARKKLRSEESSYETGLRLRVSAVEASFKRLVRREIAAYARAHNIEVVLQAGVSFAAPGTDITDAVLARLKEDYRKTQSKAEKQ